MAVIKGMLVMEKDRASAEKLVRIGAGVEKEEVVYIPIIEAAYLVDRGVLKLRKGKDALLTLAAKNDSMAKEKFRVLEHLRDRGYIVRIGLDNSEFMRLYRKGIRVGEDRTQYLLKVVKDSWKASISEIKKDVEFASSMRKELVYAVVSEKQILFIKVGRTTFD